MKAGRTSSDCVPPHAAIERQRLDKYLWFARVVKTRTLAAKLVSGGKVRVNSQRTISPSKAVGPGDVLTITLDRDIRVLKIASAGTRRGRYEEARLLYEDINDGLEDGPVQAGFRHSALEAGAPKPDKTRPDKRLRREGASLKRGD